MAQRKSLADSPCPVARSLDIVGDRWSMLIVRDAFDGLRRFGEFQASLGVARNILSDRLRTLVEEGVLAIGPASDGSAYQEYVLTAKGEALFPVVVAMRQWGEAHLYARGEKHSVLIDRATGKPVAKALPRREDGRVLRPADTLVKKVRAPG
ncbi:winged helix-turn-helix transcriptional regulator [Paracidovorax valerianellae]|uniref:Transcriptional regulator, HxlR family n=1 Tax=Paracidovorax valerianellae TaxID=187868 RepID=A0A1G6XIY9_9BURK|nr:helix-turn-helix domain-containing protein [Paracidovorax valerianellae]MDA8443468.1 helix-turn-helix transcriptional regulator [Paracidovorax valerianellae]SDD77753.1 transcriptional regulator, HxlR family [Paracidovorax valerianellae]